MHCDAADRGQPDPANDRHIIRTWVKATLGAVALIAVAFMALAGTGAYFVFRSIEKQGGSESEAVRAFDAVKARFGSRPPLVEIAGPQKGRHPDQSGGRCQPRARRYCPHHQLEA